MLKSGKYYIIETKAELIDSGIANSVLGQSFTLPLGLKWIEPFDPRERGRWVIMPIQEVINNMLSGYIGQINDLRQKVDELIQLKNQIKKRGL